MRGSKQESLMVLFFFKFLRNNWVNSCAYHTRLQGLYRAQLAADSWWAQARQQQLWLVQRSVVVELRQNVSPEVGQSTAKQRATAREVGVESTKVLGTLSNKVSDGVFGWNQWLVAAELDPVVLNWTPGRHTCSKRVTWICLKGVIQNRSLAIFCNSAFLIDLLL